jgi:hypothetical protein
MKHLLIIILIYSLISFCDCMHHDVKQEYVKHDAGCLTPCDCHIEEYFRKLLKNTVNELIYGPKSWALISI